MRFVYFMWLVVISWQLGCFNDRIAIEKPVIIDYFKCPVCECGSSYDGTRTGE